MYYLHAFRRILKSVAVFRPTSIYHRAANPFLFLVCHCSYVARTITLDEKVPDGLERWRLELAMPRLVEILEDHRTLTAVTEQVKCREVAIGRPTFGTNSQLSETLHAEANLRGFKVFLG